MRNISMENREVRQASPVKENNKISEHCAKRFIVVKIVS
jgi:hypothetical protein